MLILHVETYRSGHNGADSKSVRAYAPASSNLAVSAIKQKNRIAVRFLIFYPRKIPELSRKTKNPRSLRPGEIFI